MSETQNNEEPNAEDHAYFSHPMPVWMLLGVFFSLVFLTVLTVVMSELTEALMIGQWELWVSMGIATIKAMLVIFFFMHVLYDKPFNKMLFFSSFLFAALFIALTLLDTYQYREDVNAFPVDERPTHNIGGEVIAPK